ncbi:hypothetical protein IGJ18_002630 [Enterococcus sp. AZ078]
MKEHKKKTDFKLRNLKVPSVTKPLLDQPLDTTNQDVLYTNEYLVRRPIFYSDVNEGEHSE